LWGDEIFSLPKIVYLRTAQKNKGLAETGARSKRGLRGTSSIGELWARTPGRTAVRGYGLTRWDQAEVGEKSFL